MKRTAQDFAALGGSPAFAEPLHVGRPNIGDRATFERRMADILDRRWLTNEGPYVLELERTLCERLGVAHCVTVCNGTVALELAVRALDMRGEVIVPSFTFVATAHALQWQEITPVFCDVDPATHNLDPEAARRAITPRTMGIVGVHVWGRPCTETLDALAQEHGLKLLYDAAHAFGCTRGGVSVGNFGHAEVLSFHATKVLNAFEGGAVVTNDDALAARLRLMRNFGFEGYDTVSYLGVNGKMSEPSAAMCLTNLESLDDFIAVNRRNHALYAELLDAVPGLRVVPRDPREKDNWQYVVLEVDAARTGITRNLLLEVLHAENVLARRYFYPGCHRMEPYRTLYPCADEALPHTVALAGRILVLPTGTAVSEADVRAVCALIGAAVGHGAELTRLVRPVRFGAPAPHGQSPR